MCRPPPTLSSVTLGGSIPETPLVLLSDRFTVSSVTGPVISSIGVGAEGVGGRQPFYVQWVKGKIRGEGVSTYTPASLASPHRRWSNRNSPRRRPCFNRVQTKTNITSLGRSPGTSLTCFNLPVEIIEEREQIKAQLTPRLLLAVVENVGIHHAHGVVHDLRTIGRPVEKPEREERLGSCLK